MVSSLRIAEPITISHLFMNKSLIFQSDQSVPFNHECCPLARFGANRTPPFHRIVFLPREREKGNFENARLGHLLIA